MAKIPTMHVGKMPDYGDAKLAIDGMAAVVEAAAGPFDGNVLQMIPVLVGAIGIVAGSTNKFAEMMSLAISALQRSLDETVKLGLQPRAGTTKGRA